MSADNEPIFSAPTPGPLLKLIYSFAVTISERTLITCIASQATGPSASVRLDWRPQSVDSVADLVSSDEW